MGDAVSATASRRRWVVVAVVATAVVVVAAAGWGLTGRDVALDVHSVAPAPPPPRDAELVEVRWPAAAAWIAREADAGRPTVLNLFASWCVPCRREAPLLVAAAAAHPDVAFLGVDHVDLRAAGAAFVAAHDIDYATLYDPLGVIAAEVGARGMPATAFFDADGRLVATHTGELTAQLLEEHIAAIRG